MAACGNHGIIIPRDKTLLMRLYLDENRSMVELGAIFGVNHRSIGRVLKELRIPRRKRRTKGQSRWFNCIDCAEPTLKIRHAINGSLYGTRCKKCRRTHYAKLARAYVKIPRVKKKRDAYMARWKILGALNPNGEKQWLTKGKLLLRSNRRLLRSPHSRAAYELRNAASKLVRSLQT